MAKDTTNEYALIEKANDAIKALDLVDPLSGYAEPNTEAVAELNFGLARMYSDIGFRKYLVNELNKAIKNSALRSVTVVDVAFAKARILTLKEMLVKGKQAFEEVQRIQALSAKAKEHGKKK